MFPELSEAENATITRARSLGFAEYFPAIPSATAQALNTLRAANFFLDDLAVNKRISARKQAQAQAVE